MRLRAVAVVIENDQLLVMHRRRNGREYAVLPGGGIEPGESPQAACLRELVEETGLRGRIGNLLPIPFDAESSALYFSVRIGSGQPVLGGPERERGDAENSYEPGWVPLDGIDDIGLVPDVARTAVQCVAQQAVPGRDTASSIPMVREATMDDAAALWPLAFDLATSYRPTWARYRESLATIIADPGATVIVAVDGDSLVGYVHALVHEAFHADGSIGWIEELMVHEGRRGRGYGRDLMEAAEEWALDLADVAYIAVSTRRAEVFYQAIGYEPSATYFKKSLR